MNTQTHLLLAAAVGVAAVVRRGDGTSVRVVLTAALLGALLPDASLYVMWAQAKLAGVPDRIIWDELYYSDFWQSAGAVTNSAPAFALVLLAGLVLRRTAADPSAPRRAGSASIAFAAGALLHVATDLPLHHDDGHPHFWPLSDAIYASPVSYWDPAHHGRVWSAVEVLIGIALVARLWPHTAGARRAPLLRGTLVLALVAYVAGAAFWVMTLG